MKLFTIIDKFEASKLKKIKKRVYNESKGDFSFLTIEEVQLINGFINDNILNNYIISNGGQYIYNLNKCEKESIYIFYNEEERIYIIKQKYYQISNGKLVNIKKTYVNQKERFESKILTKVEKPKIMGKKAKYI